MGKEEKFVKFKFLSHPISSFADDTVVMSEAETRDHLKELVEEDLKHVNNWFNKMKLTINIDETKYISFSCNTTISNRIFIF